MKYKYLIITTLFFLISSSTVVANHIPDDAPPVAILKAILDLSDEQIAEIRGLIEARSAAVQPIAEQVRESRWVQLEYDQAARLQVQHGEVPNKNSGELPSCPLCAKAGLGADGLDWCNETVQMADN